MGIQIDLQYFSPAFHGLVYDALVLNKDAVQSILKKVLTGFLLGVIGIAVMGSPWQWYPGIIFDTR